MVQLTGKYKHLKNENLNEYFAAVGVPFIPRKMMCMSSPEMEITCEGDEWTIKNSSMMRTTIIKFKLNEPYEEHMPNGEILKSTTIREGDNKLITNSVISQSDVKTSRTYEFDDKGCIITLYHEKGNVTATRHFERIN